jgi:predicted alpha/beta-hydrolase family hydrolase
MIEEMPRPLLLFAPGAGAPSSHPWMQQWAKRLATVGHVVVFDYPYMRENRKRPDPLPQLIAAHRTALVQAKKDVRRGHSNICTILIGKSMGGRIGCHVASEEDVDGLVCLGYPLCAMGDRTKLRDEVLRSLRTPILFVQGTRDPLCPLDLLEAIRVKMNAPNLLHIVQSGDHSLRVTNRQLQATGETQDDVDLSILQAVRRFVENVSLTQTSPQANANTYRTEAE